MNLAHSRVDCLQGCLATLSVLVVRIVLLEAYKFIVCEFGCIMRCESGLHELQA